jgi:hypothetical protein
VSKIINAPKSGEVLDPERDGFWWATIYDDDEITVVEVTGDFANAIGIDGGISLENIKLIDKLPSPPSQDSEAGK